MLFSMVSAAAPGQKAMAVYGSKGFPRLPQLRRCCSRSRRAWVRRRPGCYRAVEEGVVEHLRGRTHAVRAVVEIPDHQRVAAPGVFGWVGRTDLVGKDVVVALRAPPPLMVGAGSGSRPRGSGRTRCRSREGWPPCWWGRRHSPRPASNRRRR